MFKKLATIGFAASATLLIAVSSFAASDHLKLNSQGELSPKACDKIGNPVINITEKVVNDVDSGQGGNYWAYDNYKRHIQVWKIDDNNSNTYCALVNYDGAKFDAVQGQVSPGATGVIGANVHGNFDGGYRGVITGTLLSNPSWDTHGNVGTVDYQCDISGNCPGLVSWIGQYFNSGYSFDYSFWGWIYKSAQNHGQWVNADYGNSGDIQ